MIQFYGLVYLRPLYSLIQAKLALSVKEYVNRIGLLVLVRLGFWLRFFYLNLYVLLQN